MNRRGPLEAEIATELARLGLSWDTLPGGGLATSGGREGLLALLRSKPVGSGWRDIFPDIPAHWIAGRPETWTVPYRPFGSYDYQEAPGSYVVHVYWEPRDDLQRLDALTAAARLAGWPVYGAGSIPMNPEVRQTHAIFVLERGVSEDRGYEFAQWLERQPGIELATIPRLGTETYVE